MKELDFTIADIKELMEAMGKHKLGCLKLKQGDFELKLEAAQAVAVSQSALSVQATTVDAYPVLPEEPPAVKGQMITSPIVGTYYEAPAPDKAPFVKVGQKVEKGDVLFIIESMKLMNEVASDYDGVVAEIFVENSQGVEYGQPILRIEGASGASPLS